MNPPNIKRKVVEVSPEQTQSKRHDMGLTKEEYTKIMSELLDVKLQNVATKDDIATVKTDIISIKEECSVLKAAVDSAKKREQLIVSELKNLQIQIRKNNLVFRGINSNPDPDEMKNAIIVFCKENLGVDNLDIQRVSQLGKNNVILVEFAKFSCVQQILRNTIKLKRSTVSIQRDLPQTMRATRNALVWLRKNLITVNKNNTYKIQGDKMLINGCLFMVADDGGLCCNGEADGTSKLNDIMQQDCTELAHNLKKVVNNNNNNRKHL